MSTNAAELAIGRCYWGVSPVAFPVAFPPPVASNILELTEVLHLRHNKYQDEKILYMIGLTENSAKGLFKLLENLLQWARAQTENMKFNLDQFLLYQDNINLFTRQLTEKN
jgi:hypothetical protein